jgi:hypothetical protein
VFSGYTSGVGFELIGSKDVRRDWGAGNDGHSVHYDGLASAPGALREPEPCECGVFASTDERMLIVVLLVCLSSGGLQASPRPDFSGTWTFDQEKTMQPGPDGRIVLAAMLGERFVAVQDATSVTFRITVQGQTVVAVYDLTGAESENLSPGDIIVKSRASWDGDKLVIDSTSESAETGRPVTIHTKRNIWIDKTGDLIIERSGTPVTQVTPSRSVYRRVRK